VLAARESDDDSDLFVGHVDPATGAFAMTLPPASYGLSAHGKGLVGAGQKITVGADPVTVTLKVDVAGPPPDDVVAWIKNCAIPLQTVEAGHGFEDLAPLAAVIGDARIVGLGEATHGTREFFQMKHRMLEFLVAKLGFTVFAIEANLPEAYAVNEYVLDGKGDPAKALAGLYFWTWDTEEVLDMIKWMRAWNADPAHVQKVKFLGFDMQTTTVAARQVQDYLGAADPAVPLLAPLTEKDDVGAFKKLSTDDRAKLRATLGELVRRLAADPKAGTIAADARVLAQAVDLFEAEAAGMAAGSDTRDAAMADNIGWLLDHEPKGTKMVVWAHNGHVSSERTETKTMGSHLKQTYGAGYVTIGFVFGEGSFQAMNMAEHKLQQWTVGPAPVEDVSTAFARAGVGALLALDLRRAPPGPIADWLAAPHPTRETGAVFADEDSMEFPMSLAKMYDAVIYVAKTTRARPVPAETPSSRP
jgi:erythromycin esterase